MDISWFNKTICLSKLLASLGTWNYLFTGYKNHNISKLDHPFNKLGSIHLIFSCSLQMCLHTLMVDEFCICKKFKSFFSSKALLAQSVERETLSFRSVRTWKLSQGWGFEPPVGLFLICKCFYELIFFFFFYMFPQI